MIKFSFVIGTLNKPEAIYSCLSSLLGQTYKNFEIVVIDQSKDIETQHIVEKLADIRIIYKHVSFTGLSKARNEALNVISGDYFCLIDDDANYEKTYLEEAIKYCTEKTILSGYIFDTINKSDFARYNVNLAYKSLSYKEIFTTCPSAALILPSNLIHEIGFFDERFGVGSSFASGEETDYLLRAIEVGYNIKYIPDMKVMHPIPIPTNNIIVDNKKFFNYCFGRGALFKKHKNNFYVWCIFLSEILKWRLKAFFEKKYINSRIILNKLLDGYRSYTTYTRR